MPEPLWSGDDQLARELTLALADQVEDLLGRARDIESALCPDSAARVASTSTHPLHHDPAEGLSAAVAHAERTCSELVGHLTSAQTFLTRLLEQ